ncbi:cytidine deaminase [Ascoidea rubescens DSM 1968]|uniref:Cytidine deaminase n=1 Tax=Ascoidea rubescens DSM 1968 TaxID=1344418 RepID=A0A1D2VCY0_9ASCO|nr:cytidine deaminase [Ascoidea rubescens DSM 1968]ODV59554.1 cytidine deaminase [Ascoidea rubescens DSM 1968]
MPEHKELSDQLFLELKKRTIQAKDLSYSPYSKFKVGCCILADTNNDTGNGNTVWFVGANVENASYGACICAERSAIIQAVMNGYKKFKAIGVSTISTEISSPCGICRQFIYEFSNGKDIPIYLFNDDGSKFIKVCLFELLPLGFGPSDLDVQV